MKRIVPLLLGLLLLTACGQATSTAPRGASRTVVDMTGRTVTVPATVTKVGTNYPAVNEILYLLGGIDRLVATDKGEKTDSALFGQLYPRIKSVSAPFTGASAEVNAEQLLADKPDVVFVVAGSSAAQRMQHLGIPAVTLTAFNTPQQIEAGVSLIARVLGGDAPARAKRFTQYYNQNIEKVTAVTKAIPDADRPKVYYTANGPLSTEGGNSIVTTWMNQAGARNIAAEHGVTAPPVFATVTLENILAWNPDFIVCRDAPACREILADPRWQAATAVREHRVLVNPQGTFVWSVRSAESALQPLWAAKTLHPEKFRDLDMSAEVQNFFHTFYGHALTGAQLDEVLHPGDQ
ncbi:ABC transporter substrate-binding protein [Sciscionella marina]|uniref:ABC transporter substrate-binding protein n=1 Tax=Sciscionella marina TaxID=508770 RepID=UPI000371B3AA|nr:ABC transporter substrate-binding protein [Sciscionella marina]